MDKGHLKVHSLTDSHEQECHIEKEGYVEAPGAEVPNASIRKSSRLQSKKRLSSFSQDIFRSFHSSSKVTTKSSKAKLDWENYISKSKIKEDKKCQLPHRNESDGLFSADTASMKSSTVVPSFTYHVRAKDGIRLVVDLNLKRSDWLRSLEKTVCVCQNHRKSEFESFRQEVQCLGNKNNLKSSSPDKTTISDASMNSYVQNRFSLKSMFRETERTFPSVVEKEVTKVSSIIFSPIDGYTKSLNSVVPDSPCEPSNLLNSIIPDAPCEPSGSELCWSKNGLSSELVHESCKNSMVQENNSLQAECPDNVAFSSEQIQFSDFSSHQKDSSCSRTGKICSENLLTSTTEVNQEAGGNHRLSTIENAERIFSAEGMIVLGIEENIQERINSAEGMEVLGIEDNVVVISTSSDGPKPKKLYHKSDCVHGQCHERILRSTKLLGGQILESGGVVIRRSSRLLFKPGSSTSGYIYK